MPLHWEEVTDDLDPTAFTITSALARQDAWAGAPGPQSLDAAVVAVRAAGYELVDISPRGATSRRIAEER